MKRNRDLKTAWLRGILLDPPRPNASTAPDEWRDNDEFEATLKLLGTERGRSAAFFKWEVVSGDLDAGVKLPMFITDVGHVLMGGIAKPGGTATGRWFVVKRGQNYGITPALPDEDTHEKATDGPTEALEHPARS
jgi:hypothetical protein